MSAVSGKGVPIYVEMIFPHMWESFSHVHGKRINPYMCNEYTATGVMNAQVLSGVCEYIYRCGWMEGIFVITAYHYPYNIL